MAKMVPVRWLGNTPIDVPSQNRRVNPGDEFDLPEHQAQDWAASGLVELVKPPKTKTAEVSTDG